jgi:predicted DsbA family dithiol-disulfide isomerase
MKRVRIVYYSDLLCVWAYVAQARIEELQQTFPDRVELEYRYFHVFGNVPGKMESAWKDRGGVAAYSQHVNSVVSQFGHVALHPQVWVHDTPKSSMPGHLMLCAVRLLESDGTVAPGTLARAAWALRLAFFRDGEDVSSQPVLARIGEESGLPMGEIQRMLGSGAAHATLAEDLDLARQHAIQASPTLLFNEGRQRLTGNVGYRIIEANIRELLENVPGQLSWC